MSHVTPDGDSPLPVEQEVAVRLAEYATLRAEILKRFEVHFQLISLTIVAAGTLLFAGVQSADRRVGAVLLLSYPFLAFLFASVWGHSDRRIAQLGHYIRTRVEPRLGKDDQGRQRMEWESYHAASQVRPRLYHFAMSWIFTGSQLFFLAVAIFVLRVDPYGVFDRLMGPTPAPLSDLVLSTLSVFAVLCVLATLYATRRERRSAP
ncbi:MAG TPA: hypothetical protein VJO13_12040 [Ktedonobacterales bacterium]|nr:hypothetical protein [Ktedonobacterales bacterium]